MCSPDSETLISTSVPISELIKHIKHSFLERDFNEVENVLTERENAMKLEIQNLIKDRDSARKEARLIETGRSEIEGKFHKLEETIDRLFKEKSAPSNREKKPDELIAEEINELKNKVGQEIEDLRHGRLAATQSVIELKRKNLEANRIIDELRLKILESDKKVEFNKSRLENLAPRIMKIEELLADILNVNVGDLAGLVGEVCKLAKASKEGANLDSQVFKGKSDSFGNGSRLDGAKDVVVKLAGCRSVGLSRRGAHDSGPPTLMSGDTVEIPDSDDEANTARPAHISSRGVRANAAENETNSEKLVQSSSLSGKNRGAHNDSGPPTLMSGDTVEIPDSDDEANTARPAHISNRGVRANAAENETNSEKLVQSSSLSGQNRGNRARPDSGDDILADLIIKRPRNMCTSHDDDNNKNVSINNKMPLQKLNGFKFNQKDSSDSDDSCSESTINDLIASLGSNKHGKK